MRDPIDRYIEDIFDLSYLIKSPISDCLIRTLLTFPLSYSSLPPLLQLPYLLPSPPLTHLFSACPSNCPLPTRTPISKRMAACACPGHRPSVDRAEQSRVSSSMRILGGRVEGGERGEGGKIIFESIDSSMDRQYTGRGNFEGIDQIQKRVPFSVGDLHKFREGTGGFLKLNSFNGSAFYSLTEPSI